MDTHTARLRSLLPVLLLLSLAVATARADPRWWWSDAPASTTGRTTMADLQAVPPVFRGDPPAVFLAWVDPPQMFEGSLHLAASFDGGCTVCQTHVESLFRPSPEVALAVTPLTDRGFYSIQVLYTDGVARIGHDASTVPLGGTAAEKCRALGEVRLEFADLGRREASSPDLAVANGATGDAHFHAVWREERAPGEWEVLYARDLAGDGSLWEARGAPMTTPAGQLACPRVSADLLCAAPPPASAVNVAAIDLAAGTLLYLRSTDSGTTFSATGAPPASPPAVLNDPGAGRAEGPFALDTPFLGTAAPLWHGCLWYEARGTGPELLLDAQHQTGPATAAPPWQPVDLPVDRAGLEQEGDPALAVAAAADGEAAPAFLFWTDARASPYEVFYRGGVLDAAAAAPVDLDRFPIPAARATDPVVSTTLQLTGCDWEPATGSCLPARPGGRAIRAAVDEAAGDVFAAWIDDRDGAPHVWLKRTDRTVAPTVPALAASCPTPSTRRITVAWPQLAGCRAAPAVAEKVARYLVYYGLAPGGPYLNTDLDGSNPSVPDTIVVADGPALPDPVVVDIDGLLPGTTYHVVVVPEDEARNVFPPDFDPLAARPTSPVNEGAVTTPLDCAERCLHRKVAATPSIAGMFMAPEPTTGISFTPPERTEAHGPCPFPSGERDPEAVLLPGAPPLACYQVEGVAVSSLWVAKDPGGETVRVGW